MSYTELPHVVEASAALGELLRLGRRSASPPVPFASRILGSASRFYKSSALFEAHFSTRALIPSRLSELESGLTRIASLGGGDTTADPRNGEDTCPICKTKITKFNAYQSSPIGRAEWVVFCEKCADLFMPAMLALRSNEGFGVD